ncbi:complement C1q-like protein 2 [Plectropomus leopardus]|uniref:complement C1q-like protein 2 n=1 Tax=Plectropomus leopardus TaxID=160734 RepID=UPI001C4CD183|nr:complement C1q-like protein 2 [Plectropomus leopardus]
MRITVISLLLLLLVGSVSTDESTTNKEPCMQDILAMLREVKAMCAQQKMEISSLKRENEEQAATLKELEEHRTEMEKLKQQLQVKQVAFSASLVDSQDKTFGPFDTHIQLIFSRITTNVGQAYNPETGIFTAPVRGVYNFEWSVGARGDNAHATAAALFRNSEHIFLAWEKQGSHFGSASNAANLFLEAGDAVYLHLPGNAIVFDSNNRHSTFSGHLIFTV